jgi:hypothetical protein
MTPAMRIRSRLVPRVIPLPGLIGAPLPIIVVIAAPAHHDVTT